MPPKSLGLKDISIDLLFCLGQHVTHNNFHVQSDHWIHSLKSSGCQHFWGIHDSKPPRLIPPASTTPTPQNHLKTGKNTIFLPEKHHQITNKIHQLSPVAQEKNSSIRDNHESFQTLGGSNYLLMQKVFNLLKTPQFTFLAP